MKKLLPLLAVIALVCGMGSGLVGCKTEPAKTKTTTSPTDKTTTTPTDKTTKTDKTT